MLLKSFNCLAIAGLTIALNSPISGATKIFPAKTTCQASISIGSGVSLTYRLMGGIDDRNLSNTPQNPVGRIIKMTVHRRDRNGRITTLLNQADVKAYEQIAPDADYSKLPFTGVFRGKPNDGFRMYGVRASTNGLYASLRPTNGRPQQMQIVHYLSSGKFVRSIAGTCQNL